ncbi:sulfite dehydrogenase [Methylobacterium sp. C25]|uniref:sulfite dehydrogenase n=1 Tax=Methylobacterium sp. C25 TaxID=2721622 RepID=UPI001F2EE770|nr:sulfite dehydrogenase [Methylobacterium sp. C25]MCE4223363.1 sulfite dehydrogenase [Methylobacterium sp. C25]
MNGTEQPVSAASRAGSLSRRRMLAGAAGLAGAAVSERAHADSLADVPARGPGASLSGMSERSSFVHISRIPESTPGKRNVDPSAAINAKAPLDKLVGTITPADFHYERSHSGVPDIDPAQHRVLVHGMVDKEIVLTMDDIRSMPTTSRVAFLECTGNGWENWKSAPPDVTVQNTHGLVSTNEWTGVPLSFLINLVGVSRKSTWMLAEGGDGSAVARSIPLTDEIIAEGMLAYGQNGEPLRPAHGFPLRLFLPGFEGNLNIKWLRRLKFGDQPFMTRWETARYTQLQADGRARQFQLKQDVNSVITTPSGMMQIRKGYHRISGLAWSGHGRITRVEVSTDGARTWRDTQISLPALPKAQTRFEIDWDWDGTPTKIVSRSTDDKGNMQPDRDTFIAMTGTNALFHYNAQQTWAIAADGAVRNVLA